MTDDTAVKATLGGRRTGRGKGLALTILLAVVVGGLLAWDVWEAIGNLVGIRAYAAGLGTDLNATGWTVLLLSFALPVVCFVLALVLGRRRGVAARAGLLLAALCVSAALSLDLQQVFGFASLVTLG